MSANREALVAQEHVALMRGEATDVNVRLDTRAILPKDVLTLMSVPKQTPAGKVSLVSFILN